MSQTPNLGLPLWGETPPEGASGKTLRDAIIGESESSMAQILDAAIGRGLSEIIIEAQELAFGLDDNFGLHVAALETTATLSEGTIYTVAWGEDVFTCAAYALYGTVVLGNASLLGDVTLENTEEPFIIGIVDGFVTIGTENTDSVRIVSITKNETLTDAVKELQETFVDLQAVPSEVDALKTTVESLSTRLDALIDGDEVSY